MSDQLWAELEAQVVDRLLHGSQESLASAFPCNGPGAYALFFADIPLACFDHPGMRGAGWPCYVGVADRSLSGRLTEHRQALRLVQNLSAATFQVIALETPSGAAASFAESTLIRLFQPAYNRVATGLGAKPAGKRREGQRASAFSVLHPGRPGPTGAPKLAKPALELAVRKHLDATVPLLGAWS